MVKQIQWFPGHMQKTLNEFLKLKKEINLIFLLLDSRAPRSSFIDTFGDFIKDKKVIIVFTKNDLVNKNELDSFISEYKKSYLDCISLSLNDSKTSKFKILNLLNKNKNSFGFTKFTVIGIPNVGKSTFINILKGKKSAVAKNIPGVTRNLKWYQVDNYLLLDSPGILAPKFVDKNQGIKLALIGSIKIDLLPLEEVIENMFLIFENKNTLIKYKSFSDFKTSINNINNQDKIYKKLIYDFQNLKYGKIILD